MPVTIFASDEDKLYNTKTRSSIFALISASIRTRASRISANTPDRTPFSIATVAGLIKEGRLDGDATNGNNQMDRRHGPLSIVLPSFFGGGGGGGA